MTLLRLALPLALFLVVAGCPGSTTGGGSAGASENAEEVVYECPMHCIPEGQDEEHTQSEPGDCPVCGMALRVRE